MKSLVKRWLWWWGKKGEKRTRPNFYFMLGAGMVVLAVSAIRLSVSPTPVELPNVLNTGVEEEKVTWPLNTGGSPVPEVSALSAVVFDVDSERILWSKNAKEPRLPASTTKIMTALVVMDAVEKGELTLEQVAVVPEVAVRTDGQKIGLAVGEPVTINNLLYGLLLGSGNDAAETLAAAYPGGRVAMVAAMNKKAAELGLVKTNFTNPEGYDEYLHFTTAEDLGRLAKAALDKELFAKIVGTAKVEFFSFDGKEAHAVRNLNELLGEVPGVRGVKTGWTEVAGGNLVAAVARDGHEVIVVVLRSDDRFGESKKLIDWVFDNFSWPGERE